MPEEILVRTSGRATEIVLNRPDAGNGVTDEMAAALGTRSPGRPNPISSCCAARERISAPGAR